MQTALYQVDEEALLRQQIAELDRELEATRAKYRRLRKKRRKLAAQLKALPTYAQRSGMQDEWMVRSEDVLRFIARYILEHDGEHGNGGIASLADRSGVSTRTISDVIHGRRIMVTLSTADMLLTAAGEGWQLGHMERFRNNRGRPPKPPESKYYEE